MVVLLCVGCGGEPEAEEPLFLGDRGTAGGPTGEVASESIPGVDLWGSFSDILAFFGSLACDFLNAWPGYLIFALATLYLVYVGLLNRVRERGWYVWSVVIGLLVLVNVWVIC